MSTEEDIATIEAVTAKIAGPLKVWILFIDDSANGNEDHHSVYLTEAGALEAAQIYLEQVVQVWGQDVHEYMHTLKTSHFLVVRGTQFTLMQREVKP